MSAQPGLPLLLPCTELSDDRFDGVVLVTDSLSKLQDNLACLKDCIEAYAKVDDAHKNDVIVTSCAALPSKRLIFSPTGPLCRDYDDVRRFSDAANAGIKRAVKAGCKNPLLVRAPDTSFPQADFVAALGALYALYVPLEIREDVPARCKKAERLGIWCATDEDIAHLTAIEQGRVVARDIGGSDPERMAAPRIEEYVKQIFKDTCIKITVETEFEKSYPLLSAVNRCARLVPRHTGRLIYLDYEGEGKIEKTLFLVGKGITYDTGGADIKAGGIMAGMHRDKCGAAFVAGFFKMLSIMKPKGVAVHGGMACVRNSVGSECYVADEIITSRAGARVRVGNTDAEGRMAMADVLCKLKEDALTAVNPQLFTIATLTGHAIIAMGPAYSIVMDNGPARKLNNAQSMQSAGDKFGDPFEISNIRREDYEHHAGKSEYEEILQCNNAPSSRTPRGHQSPSAFLIMASGLDKHGVDSEKPLPYSHIDIAGSSGPFPGVPTGSPIMAFAANFFL